MIAIGNIEQFIVDHKIQPPQSTQILERAVAISIKCNGIISCDDLDFILGDAALSEMFLADFHSDASGTQLEHFRLAMTLFEKLPGVLSSPPDPTN